MNVTALIVVVVVLVIIIAAIVAWYTTSHRQRSERLREQFGPEYDHTVEHYGERRQAEHDLAERSDRVAALHIHPLSADDGARYSKSWHDVQTRFVDDPENAIREADRLCAEVMQARGYPMGDFEQRAADVSVDHPLVVEHYRAGHALALDAGRGTASTEQLRQAMVHYRTLFEDLIESREPARTEDRSRA